MLNALKAPTGRPGYGPEVLFRAYLATFVLNSSSISAGLRAITDDSALADIVGGTPTKYAVCRFIAKLKDTDIMTQFMAIVATQLRELMSSLDKGG